MLADIAEELQRAHAGEPFVVVGHQGGIVAFEAKEGLHLTADLVHPAGHHLRGVELALAGLEAGVAYHAGGAAHQGDGAVPGHLEALEQQQRHQVAQVQAIGGGVETAVQGDRFPGQQRVERVRVGDLRDQAALLQIPDQGRLLHFVYLHDCGARPCWPRVRTTARRRRQNTGSSPCITKIWNRMMARPEPPIAQCRVPPPLTW